MPISARVGHWFLDIGHSPRRHRRARRTPHALVVQWEHTILSRWRHGFNSRLGRWIDRWHGTPTGRATKLKPWSVWVRLPPVLLETRVGRRWDAGRPVKPPRSLGRFDS